jgi:carboxylesterase
VYVPRLAGHGTDPADLARCHWSDWLNSTLDAYYVLHQQCAQVFICGLSMGGVLALLASTIVPVDGVVVMGSPLVLGGDFTSQALSQAKLIQPTFDSTDTSSFADYIREQQAKRGEPVLGRVRYNRWYTAALEQLALLIEAAQGRLAHIQALLLAIYSENDQTVGLHNQQYLLEHVGSSQVESHTFKHSGHILTQDIEHPEVFRLAAAFIAKHTHP